MRFLALCLLVVAACESSSTWEECEVAQSVTASFKGVVLQPNNLGEVPDGALEVGDNVVLSREGIVEPRRGTEEVATKAITRAYPFKGEIVGHGGTVLSHSADGATWSDYAGDVAKPADAPLRAAEAVGNLYLTTSDGVKRLDSLTGTPLAAGVPGGLDVEVTEGATGTAVPTNAQVAYRVAFGRRDANRRLLLGAPSGRAVYTNTSGAVKDATVGFSLPRGLLADDLYQVYRSRASVTSDTDPGDELGLVLEGPVPQTRTISSLSRTTNVVTATTTAAHGYSAGMLVRVSPGGGTGGTVATVGLSSVASTSPDGITWTSRTIPAGEWRAVAWNGSTYVAVGSSVVATSPDGVTWTARTIAAGTWRAVTWGGSGFVAVGDNVAATSPDGVTWTSRTIPTGTYYGVVWHGTLFVAAGPGATGACATSPDGVTWTARTIPVSQTLGVASNGTLVVAVGGSVGGGCATSTDGITWTARTISGSYWAATWNGSLFVAVGGSGVASTSPDGITWTSRTLPSAVTWRAATWNGSVFVAVGDSVAATSPDGITWTARTIAAGGYQGIAASGSTFAAGDKTVTGVPLSTTFTYAETGADATLSQTQTAVPLTAAALDTVPDGFLGAYLYTNANTGEGIGNANSPPPAAKDIAAFRDTLFALNFSAPAYGEAYLLSVGGANGLQSGDTVTINGLVYTAGASESVSTRTFKLDASSSLAAKITKTAASLIRIVNRSLSSGVTARDLSDPSGVPGLVGFEATDAVSSLTVTFSRSTAWSPSSGISASPKIHKNGLAYSKPSEPDHFPQALTLVPVKVGSQDKAGLRLTPIRDSSLLWKEDGLWKITGAAGVWSVDPLDPTVVLLASESAVALNGAVYALTNQGVVRANESGVEIVSRDIEPAIMPLLAPSMRATTAALAFGVAYESDRKYMLWLPSASSDTECTQAWVYDVITGSWTRRTDPAAHALVNPQDDRLYKITSGKVRKERKTLTAADYQDATGVAIPIVVQPAPKLGGNPAALHLFNEAAWLFRSVQFANATAAFRTNISGDWTDVPLVGTDYGCASSAVADLLVRVPVPQEKARGSQMSMRWTQSQAGADFQLQGLSLTYRTCSTRTGR